MKSEVFPDDADSRPAEALRIEALRVIGEGFSPAVVGRPVLDIISRQSAEQNRRVPHRAGHRAGGILRVRNGDHSCAADEADSRLDAHDPVDR